MKYKYSFIVILLFTHIFISCSSRGREPVVITVTCGTDDDCLAIRQAIAEVEALNGAPSVIKFAPGTYHLRHTQASKVKYYISNTLSWSDNPDNIKHIAIHLKNLSNVTIDGSGALFLTHGEVTTIAIDGCHNIRLKNIMLDAADPTLTEMTVESIKDDIISCSVRKYNTPRGVELALHSFKYERKIVFRAHETSNFQVSGTTLTWKGEGWSFTGGPAQIYDPYGDVTWRSWNPQESIKSIKVLDDKRMQITYSSRKEAEVGYTFQMRDGNRDEVAGFVLRSKDICFEGVKMHFMGNFGIVCQYSDGVTFSRCDFVPNPESGRTSCGFADFLQVSGCKGLLKVEDCRFQGAHDDPINVHGTYLKVVEYPSPTRVKVQFQHHQSWGFDAFFVGDKIEFIDANTMFSLEGRTVTAVTRVDDRNIYIDFDQAIASSSYSDKSIMVENVTWTPEVEIRRCHFSRVPTRGILLTTRGRSVIEYNMFYKMQMAGIYVSGDARNWFESGKVADLTIRGNKFVECGDPVIYFDPTNVEDGGAVHSNVKITENEFYIKSGLAVGGKSVNNLSFSNNTIYSAKRRGADSFCSLTQSTNVVSEGNVVIVQ